jgi:HSP20 family protein
MAQEVAEKREKKETVPVQRKEGQRRGEFDRMFEPFEQMMTEWWRRPLSLSNMMQPRTWLGESMLLRAPAVDVYEEAEEVVLKAEMPGMSKEDLQINLSDSVLTISGEKKKEEDVKEEDYTYSERSYGSFSRSLQLPCAVKADQAKAIFNNGVLEVKLPKTEEAKTRRTTVKIE